MCYFGNKKHSGHVIRSEFHKLKASLKAQWKLKWCSTDSLYEKHAMKVAPDIFGAFTVEHVRAFWKCCSIHRIKTIQLIKYVEWDSTWVLGTIKSKCDVKCTIKNFDKIVVNKYLQYGEQNATKHYLKMLWEWFKFYFVVLREEFLKILREFFSHWIW